jgi:hypothetical protein
MRLPLGYNFGIGIMAASSERLSCSVEFAIIAAVSVCAATGGGLFRKNHVTDRSEVDASGDHLTYLRVFTEWTTVGDDSEEQDEYCSRRGVHLAVLVSAAALVERIHRAMASCEPPLPLLSRRDPTNDGVSGGNVS